MDWFQIGEGIHQGCILSPCLFNFYVESVSQFSHPFMSDSLRLHDGCTPGFPVHYQLPEFTQTHVHRVDDASNHLIVCHPLLFLPSIFPSIRVFSNELVLPIRWPECWSFSFSIRPSNEYSGLISFRIDWLNNLAVQGTLKSVLNTTVQKHQFFCAQLSLWSNYHIHT